MAQNTGMSGSSVRLPRWKRVVFSLVAVLMTYGACELIAVAVLLIRFRELPTMEQISARSQDNGSLSNDKMGAVPAASIHPYFGYVHTPRTTPRTTMYLESLSVTFDKNHVPLVSGYDISRKSQPVASDWGFLDSRSPLRKRTPGKLIVGLLGGSVAESFSIEGAERLAMELRHIERFAGQDIEFVHLALQGFKQPQQLLEITYILSLGGEFDVLINLDGFNELFISIYQNHERGVAASYPMVWDLRLETTSTGADPGLMARIIETRRRRAELADDFGRFPWRSSNLAKCVWLVWNDRIARDQTANWQKLAAAPPSPKSLAMTGPHEEFRDKDALFRHCVDIWRRSSIQLHELCTLHGIVYYHFLQPNQYVPDSKPMTQAERDQAVTPDSPFDRVIRTGYPLLEAAGEELRASGVRFHSLTHVFQGHEEPLYKDNCCHLNQSGSEVMAVEVARFIGEN